MDIEFLLMVIFANPAILLALICLLMAALVNVFWGDTSKKQLFIFPSPNQKKARLACGLLLSVAFLIWIILSLVYHTSMQNDFLAFVQIIVFSVLWLYLFEGLFALVKLVIRFA